MLPAKSLIYIIKLQTGLTFKHMKTFAKAAVSFFILLAVVFLLSKNLFFPQNTQPLSYDIFGQMLTSQEILQVRLDGNRLYIFKKDGSSYLTEIPPEQAKNFLPVLIENNVAILTGTTIDIRTLYLPMPVFGADILLSVLLSLWYTKKAYRKNSNETKYKYAGRARMAGQRVKYSFADIVLRPDERLEIERIIEFLKRPHRFVELGAKIEKGILVIGPTGIGKTKLAKVIAGEAGVPFFYINGSEAVEWAPGLGVANIKESFERAKKNAPCFMFIDQIDFLARKRSSWVEPNQIEQECVLSQLLDEMDGFGTAEGVIVLGATARPDLLDDAILRPGRFDSIIELSPPSLEEVTQLVRLYSLGKPLAEDVRTEEIADRIHKDFGKECTGAIVENILNRAALVAADREDKTINKAAVYSAIADCRNRAVSIASYNSGQVD